MNRFQILEKSKNSDLKKFQVQVSTYSFLKYTSGKHNFMNKMTYMFMNKHIYIKNLEINALNMLKVVLIS